MSTFNFSHFEYLLSAYVIAGLIMSYIFLRAFRKAEKAQKSLKAYRNQEPTLSRAKK